MRRRGRRPVPLALALAPLALAIAPAVAGTPYRGWQRGQVAPIGPSDQVEEVALANGAVVRYRRAKDGRRYFLGEISPGALSLPALVRFPQEKLYRELVGHGRYDAAAELLDKLLADPANGQRIVEPPWAPWESPGWTSVQSLARARLLALPDAGREAFRRLRDDEANGRFAAAEASGDPLEISLLLERYPVASGASRAAIVAGDLDFEAGDFLAAAESWGFAEGDPELPDASRATLAAKVTRARLLLRARTRPESPATLPASAAAELGALSLPPRPPLRLVWRRRIAPRSLSGATPLPGLLASAAAEAVFVADASGVLALDRETGRLLWKTELDAGGAWAGDDAPATVAVGDSIGVVRGRRIAYALDRESGRVLARVDIVRDLAGGADDHIDAVACGCGRLVLAASLGPERVVVAFERTGGSPVYRTALWAPGGLDASLVAAADGTFVAADGGVAALDHSGAVRWIGAARPDLPARSPERGLVAAGERLLRLELRGFTALDRATGTQVGLSGSGIEPDALVVGTADEGPVVLEPTTHPSPDGRPLDSRPLLLAPRGRALVPLRRVEFDDRPAFPGVVARGALYLPAERAIVGFDLATGREVARVPVAGGPGRLSATGDLVVLSHDDEVLAFASRPSPDAPGSLPDAPRELAKSLASPDWRERDEARARLEHLGDLALPALRASIADTRAPLEERAAAREILDELEARGAWQRAFPDLASGRLARLVAPQPIERLRAILSLPDARTPDEATARLRAEALRRAAARDPDACVRVEALARLAALDAGARGALVAVLEAKGEGAAAADLELAQAAAAAGLANSGAARAGSPGHADLERLLGNAPEPARVALYRALLRHGGRCEQLLVIERAAPLGQDGKSTGATPDPIAKRVLASWVARPERDDLETLEGDSVEASQRRAELEGERRALLARPELAPVLGERAP